MQDLDANRDSDARTLKIQNEKLRRKTEELEMSRARYAGIIESAMDAIICLDENFKIETFNAAAEQMFGFKAGEMIGQPIDRLVPVAHRNAHRAHMQCFRESGVTHRRMNALGDLHGVRADGAEFPVEVAISRVDISGAPILAAIVRDVSERHRAEEAVRMLNTSLELRVAERTTELELALHSLNQSHQELTRSEAKAMLSTMAASVSHELNSPIGNAVLAASTLSGLLQNVRASIEDGSGKRSDLLGLFGDMDSCCALIERNLRRAEALLTSFRQVAADQASEQRRTFDLANTIKDVIHTLSPSLKRHPHRIEVNIPAGIAMDSQPGPLGQVVINLVNNAYLHAFEGRADGLLTIAAEAESDWVALRFADNGVGIPEENLEKLFQPFFSTKIGKGGSGLGMAIVKNLVTKTLCGKITVQSTVGQGTRFDIRLPLVLPDGGWADCET